MAAAAATAAAVLLGEDVALIGAAAATTIAAFPLFTEAPPILEALGLRADAGTAHTIGAGGCGCCC